MSTFFLRDGAGGNSFALSKSACLGPFICISAASNRLEESDEELSEVMDWAGLPLFRSFIFSRVLAVSFFCSVLSKILSLQHGPSICKATCWRSPRKAPAPLQQHSADLQHSKRRFLEIGMHALPTPIPKQFGSTRAGTPLQ